MKRKRWRVKHAKPGQLRVYYGKEDSLGSPDVCFAWGPGTSRADSSLIHSMFSGFSHRKGDGILEPKVQHDGYLKELEARGYDLTTIKFSIEKKPNESKG